MNKKISFFLMAIGSFVGSYDAYVNHYIAVGMYETTIVTDSYALFIALIFATLGVLFTIIGLRASKTDILE